jgi:hypothetical protein
MLIKILLMGILMCGAAAGIAAETPLAGAGSRADARTPEAVKAADAAWLDAEINGDYKFLEWFLLDGYESIGATGSIFSRAALIENRRLRGRSDEFAKQVREWREQHPNHAEVKIYGDTAVLTWVADDPSSKTPVYSCDIFTYQNRHWHAIYSQHSTTGG